MTPIMIVALFGVLLVLFGAAIGAEFQDRMHEGQRRRMAVQRREINARWRALRARGAAADLVLPFHQMILPVALEEDSAIRSRE